MTSPVRIESLIRKCGLHMRLVTMVGKAARYIAWSGRVALRDAVKNGLLASSVIPPRLRPLLLAPFGVSARGAAIAPRVFIGSGPLHMGRGSFLNYGVFVDPSGGITMGSSVRCGPRAMLITASHRIGETEETRTLRAPETDITAPIVIGDNVWIGAGVTVLPGVTIGPGVVVAAGAVVVDDCAPNTLYGGVPARALRRL